MDNESHDSAEALRRIIGEDATKLMEEALNLIPDELLGMGDPKVIRHLDAAVRVSRTLAEAYSAIQGFSRLGPATTEMTEALRSTPAMEALQGASEAVRNFEAQGMPWALAAPYLKMALLTHPNLARMVTRLDAGVADAMGQLSHQFLHAAMVQVERAALSPMAQDGEFPADMLVPMGIRIDVSGIQDSDDDRPLAERYADRHPGVVSILRFMEFKHLKNERAQAVSGVFYTMAEAVLEMFPNDDPELTVALRKLREAKDCLVGLAAVSEEPGE